MSRPQAPACIEDPPPGTLPPLARAQLHEVHAEAEDWASALAFAFGMVEAEAARPILLLRPRRKGAGLVPCGEGLRALGVDPARLVIVDARNNAALLRAGLDAARSSGPAAVLMESWGAMREYDLVASRRLILAAEGSRIPVVILRGDAEPRSSAAHTRWTVSSAPSTPLEMRAPGAATLLVELVRRRGGPAGQRWRLEWNEDHGGFRELPLDTRPSTEERGPPLPGTVVPLSAVRARAPLRRTA